MLPIEQNQKKTPIERLYDNTTNIFDLPDFDTFKNDMKNPKNRAKFHTNLLEAGYDVPDYQTFQNDLGFESPKELKVMNDRNDWGLLNPFIGLYDNLRGQLPVAVGSTMEMLSTFKKADPLKFAEGYGLEKLGENIVKIGSDYQKSITTNVDGLLYDLGQGAGSIITAIASSLLAGPGGAIASTFMLEGGSAYADAKEYNPNASEEELLIEGAGQGILNTIIEFTTRGAVSRYVPWIKESEKGIISKAVNKFVKNGKLNEVVKTMGGEAAQEFWQEIVNLSAEAMYKKGADKPTIDEWIKRSSYSAFLGGLLGGGTEGLRIAFGGDVSKDQQKLNTLDESNAGEILEKHFESNKVNKVIKNANTQNIDPELDIIGNNIQGGLESLEDKYNQENATLDKKDIENFNNKEKIIEISENSFERLESDENFSKTKDEILNLINTEDYNPKELRSIIRDLAIHSKLNTKNSKAYIEQKYPEFNLESIQSKLEKLETNFELVTGEDIELPIKDIPNIEIRIEPSGLEEIKVESIEKDKPDILTTEDINNPLTFFSERQNISSLNNSSTKPIVNNNINNFLNLYFKNEYSDEELESSWMKLDYNEKDKVRRLAGIKLNEHGVSLDDLIWKINSDLSSNEIKFRLINGIDQSLNSKIKKELETTTEYKLYKEYEKLNTTKIKELQKNPIKNQKTLEEIEKKYNQLLRNVHNKEYDIQQNIIKKTELRIKKKTRLLSDFNTKPIANVQQQKKVASAPSTSLLDLNTIVNSKRIQENPNDKKLFEWFGTQLGNIKISFSDKLNSTRYSGSIVFKDGIPNIDIANNISRQETRQTLIEELGHAVTLKSLEKKSKNYNKEFDNEITSIRESIKDKALEAGISPYYLNDNIEFVAGMLRNDLGLKQFAQNTKVDKTSLVEKIKNAILKLFKKLGLTDPTVYDTFELALMKEFGYKPSFASEIAINQAMDEIESKDISQEEFDKLQQENDRLEWITDDRLNDSQMIDMLGKTLQLSNVKLGKNIDHIKILQTLSEKELGNKLSQVIGYEDKINKLYETKGKPYGLTIEEFKEKTTRQLYERVNSLIKIKHAKLVDGKLIELDNKFFDMYGNVQNSYVEDMPIYDVLTIASKNLGIELKPTIIDHEEINKKYKNGWRKIVGKLTKGKYENRERTKTLFNNGYFYLGTFSDKGTAIAIKVNNKELWNRLKPILEEYQQKIQVLNEQGKTNWDINNISAPLVFRMYLEDIKLGRMLNNNKTVLFNPENSKSYDVKDILKRSYLVSKKGFFREIDKEAKEFFKSNEKHIGMTLTNNDVLVNSVIVSSKSKQFTQEELESMDEKTIKHYDLIDNILTNLKGTEGLDGAIIYLIGKGQTIDFYRQHHGAINPGKVKAHIINNMIGDKFNQPFYAKFAFHGINIESPLGQWMVDNELGFVISDTAAKVNSYSISNLMEDIEENKMFQIPMSSITRQNEKGHKKLSAKGLYQTFGANFLSDKNISIKKAGGTKIFYNTKKLIEKKIMKDFEKGLLHFDSDIVKFIKDRIFNKTDDKSRALSNILAPMLKSKDFAAIIEHPSFNSIIQDYVNSLMTNYLKMGTNGTYVTLHPDLGTLSAISQKSKSQLLSEFPDKQGEDLYNQAFNEYGKIQKGYTVISQQDAKLHNIKLGDRINHFAVPSNNMSAAGSSIVVGIMKSSYMEAGSMLLNSEYIQTMVGKDFDIDTLLMVPFNSEYMDKKTFNEFGRTLNKISDLIEEDTYRTFKRVLGSKVKTGDSIINKDGINVPEIIKFNSKNQIYDPKIRRAFVREFYPKIDNIELINPISPNTYDIMDKFRKQVGEIISRRKLVQIFTDIGFETKVGTQKITPNNPSANTIATLRGEITEHFVDMPTNDGSFYYHYDKNLSFNQDFGTKLHPKIAQKLNQVNQFLFGDITKLSSGYYQKDMSYKDKIKTITSQKLKQKWMKQKNIKALINKFIEGVGSITREQREYFNNINYENLDFSKNLITNYVENIDLEKLPSVGMEARDYILTENKSLMDILNKRPKLQKLLENKINKYGSSWRLSPSDLYDLSKWKTKNKTDKRVSIERILGGLWYSTADTELHKLKSDLIQLILPTIELTEKHIKGIKEKSYTYSENSPVKMAAKSRAKTYPKLFKLVLNQSILRLKHFDNIKIDNFTFENNGDGILIINGTPHTKVQPDILDEFFTKFKNRQQFDKIMYLSSNTFFEDRLELAKDILDKLNIYNKEEQEVFWISLMGIDPEINGTSRIVNSYNYPTNLIPSYKKEDGYHTNNLLLRTMSMANSLTAYNLLKEYGNSFGKNYQGMTWKEKINLSNKIIQDRSIDNITYFSERQNKLLDKLDEEAKLKYNFSSLKGISRRLRNEGNIPYNEKDENLGLTLSFTEGIKKITGYDISKEENIVIFEKEHKAMQLEITDVDIYKHKLDKIESVVTEQEQKSNEFFNGTNGIRDLEKQALGEVKARGMWKHNANQSALFYESINEIIEEGKAIDPNAVEGIEHIKQKAVQKFNNMYNKEYPRYAQQMIQYLELTKSNLKNRDNRKIIEDIQKRWEGRLKAMEKLAYKYIPHEYSKRTLKTKILPKQLEAIKQRLREETEREKKLLEDPKTSKIVNIEYAKNAGNEDWIVAKANEEIKELENRIKLYHGGIDPRFMTRKIKEPSGKLYDTSTLEPHINHNRMFWQTVKYDLTKAAYLEFKEKASEHRIKPEYIFPITKKTSDMTPDKFMANQILEFNEIKPGMTLQFWHNGIEYTPHGEFLTTDFIEGIVKKSDKDNVWLKVNAKQHEYNIRNEIAKYQKISSEVAARQEKNRKPTAAQKRTLKVLAMQGYSDISTADTYAEINDLILQGKINELRNKENWGKFSKKDIYQYGYTREGENVQIPGQVRRYIVPQVGQEQIAGIREKAELNNKQYKNPLRYAGLLDQALTVGYIGTIKSGIKNWTRGMWALVGIDPYGVIKRAINPANWGEYIRIHNDVKTEIEAGNFDKWNKNYIKSLPLERDRKAAAKRRIVMMEYLSEGLMHDETMYRIVTESNAFDDISRRNGTLDNIQLLMNVINDKSGYSEYITKLEKLIDDKLETNTITEQETIEKKIKLLKLEYKLARQKLIENFSEVDTKSIDKKLAEVEKQVHELRKQDKFEEAQNLLEKLELTKTEAIYATFKLGSKALTKFAMYSFKTFEQINRFTTILYTVDKAIEQGMDITDSDKIHSMMYGNQKITQGLYGVTERRIGDRVIGGKRHGLGRLAFKFGHYNYYNWQNTVSLIRQGMKQVNNDETEFLRQAFKGLFQKEYVTNKGLIKKYIEEYKIKNGLLSIDKETRSKLEAKWLSEHADDLIKPGETNIPAKVLKSILVQSWGISIAAVLSGLALDSYPVHLTLYNLVLALLDIFKDGDVDKDDLEDWETRKAFMDLGSFTVGLGVQLPIQITTQIMLSGKIKPEQITKQNMPTLVKDITEVLSLTLEEGDPNFYQRAVGRPNRWIKLFTGLQPFPYSAKWNTKTENKYSQMGIDQKIWTIFNPVNYPVTLAPFPIRELHKKEIMDLPKWMK